VLSSDMGNQRKLIIFPRWHSSHNGKLLWEVSSRVEEHLASMACNTQHEVSPGAGPALDGTRGWANGRPLQFVSVPWNPPVAPPEKDFMELHGTTGPSTAHAHVCSSLFVQLPLPDGFRRLATVSLSMDSSPACLLSSFFAR